MAALPKCADQMCRFVPDLARSAGASPDRVDALVWALTDLLVEQMFNHGIFELYRHQAEQLAAKNAPAKREVSYAIGSREYAEQQRRLKEGNRQ